MNRVGFGGLINGIFLIGLAVWAGLTGISIIFDVHAQQAEFIVGIATIAVAATAILKLKY